MVFNLVVGGKGGWVSTRSGAVGMVSSTGVPFCRSDCSLRGVLPIHAPLFRSEYVDQGVSDGCVAILRDLDHDCVLPTEVHIRDQHLLTLGVEEANARA